MLIWNTRYDLLVFLFFSIFFFILIFSHKIVCCLLESKEHTSIRIDCPSRLVVTISLLSLPTTFSNFSSSFLISNHRFLTFSISFSVCLDSLHWFFIFQVENVSCKFSLSAMIQLCLSIFKVCLFISTFHAISGGKILIYSPSLRLKMNFWFFCLILNDF